MSSGLPWLRRMYTNPIIDVTTYMYTNPINDKKPIQSLNVLHNLDSEKS